MGDNIELTVGALVIYDADNIHLDTGLYQVTKIGKTSSKTMLRVTMRKLRGWKLQDWLPIPGELGDEVAVSWRAGCETMTVYGNGTWSTHYALASPDRLREFTKRIRFGRHRYEFGQLDGKELTRCPTPEEIAVLAEAVRVLRELTGAEVRGG